MQGAFGPWALDNEDEMDQIVWSTVMTGAHMLSQPHNSDQEPDPDRQAQSHGGSSKGKQPNTNRARQEAYQRFYQQYLQERPMYSEPSFQRRYGVSLKIFRSLCTQLADADPYFQQSADATGLLGHRTEIKVAAALRQLRYGVAADALDDSLQISETVANDALKLFCYYMVKLFRQEWIRPPRRAELEKILAENEDRGFPGMLGSVDCMHWAWKNCPVAWRGQFQGKEGVPTLVLEAACSKNLRFWHVFFGTPGVYNDLNTLDRSPLLTQIVEQTHLPVTFSILDQDYNIPYYLADGIYPDWLTFVKTVSQPRTPMEKAFSQQQEAVRKDIERAFGVLQARFHIIQRPCLLWHRTSILNIMLSCIILHNMMMEQQDFDEPSEVVPAQWEEEDSPQPSSSESTVDRWLAIKDAIAHRSMKAALIKHCYLREGSRRLED